MIERWLHTCRNSKINLLRQLEIFTMIDVMYRDGRAYHNMKHIELCFKELDTYITKVKLEDNINLN